MAENISRTRQMFLRFLEDGQIFLEVFFRIFGCRKIFLEAEKYSLGFLEGVKIFLEVFF